MLYTLSEVFYSIQGEGILQGLPMVFIRLSGCNLKCSFCDTKYALKSGRPVTAGEIIRAVGKYPCRRVCITGGEPFLQDLSVLTETLKKKGYWISAETNGTVWQKLSLDWITVSPKTGGKKFYPRGYDRRFLKVASEFKYVITGRKSLDFIDTGIRVPVVLQPVDNDIRRAKEITEFLKKNPGKNRYLRMQMHKLTGIR